MLKIFVSPVIFIPILLSVASAQQSGGDRFKLDYEKFTLPNGLEVIFHIDRSDPIVAVNLTAHVGSAREKAERTGFAHLFEHLLFLESENLGKGGLDKLTARIGGSGANGSTNRDRTNYLQTIPNDALEKMLWAEADKLGWFINTVTEPVLAKEKQVVKNEKRQSVDNNPYGHTSYVIDKHLYPEDHPYNWQVIGSLEDLQNATLDDVKEFYRRWYVSNNVTLMVSGDFDKNQARQWVEKYFSEIKRGDNITPLPKRPGVVKETIKLYHEDNFALLPELTMAWPTVEGYHPDANVLKILAAYLSMGKNAPFYRVIVEDQKLSSGIRMFNYASELAGQFILSVRAFKDKDLDAVARAVQTSFSLFEKEGIPQKDIDRIKAGFETQFYNSLSSVLGKGVQLVNYNLFAGDPGFIETDFKNMQKVTTADVMRVYNQYIRNKNYVATSFVPKSKTDLALEGSKRTGVVEEQITEGPQKEDVVDPTMAAIYERAPSSFDRTKEPPFGPEPQVKTPVIWEDKMRNGLRIYGIENTEVPLVQFEIVIDGGVLLEDIQKVGVSNLLASLMTQGTKKKTPQQLDEAIQHLGASISVSSGMEDIRINVNTLAKHYTATLALLEEILLEPRWDMAEFDLAKQSTISLIRQQEANPNNIADNQFNQLIYGKENIRSRNILGTIASVNAITLKDLQDYYSKNISPSVARMHVVGAINQSTITSSLNRLVQNWKPIPVTIPVHNTAIAPKRATVYFYDVPDAKQSVVRIGYRALAATDNDFYPATLMNFRLGGGDFASQLTQQLREGKGYTYVISSSFSGTDSPGPFTIGSSIRTNVTLEAAQLTKTTLDEYGKNYSDTDLETTKDFIIKSNARDYETTGAKLNILGEISKYGWSYEYLKDRQQIVRDMTVAQMKNLSEKYVDAGKMIWLIVGDAKTQLGRMKELGFGEPVLIGN